MSERWLVVRLGSLGDIVHTFPAVAALRESFPQAEITWLTHPRWRTLVESSELATEIWEVNSRSGASLRDTITRIRDRQFPVAIDYQGLWKSASLPFLGGVRRRIGFSAKTIREFGVPALYTDRVRCERTHVAEQNGELSQHAGAQKGVSAFGLKLSAREESAVLQMLRGYSIESYVVLSPAGGWRSKCWPAECYGALCQSIRRELGLRCVVNFGPGEEEVAAAVKASSRGSEPVAYSGSLPQLMALLRNAKGIVSGDTGPLHLAVALGTPVVALFGPTDPARNGPYHAGPVPGKDIVLRSPRARTTYKRRDEPDASFRELHVETVSGALRKLIETRP